MPSDPVLRLAKLRVIKASADLEVQLAMKEGSAPALEILRRLRDRAAENLPKLAFLNLDNPNDFIAAKVIQNEVKRYDEWITWMGEIVAEGKAYDHEFQESEREEILDMLAESPEGMQEAVALGLIVDNPRQDG